MSYILDALRKADAQRERDPTRGIHAQPLRGAPAPTRPSEGQRAWLWATGAMGLAALASAGWYFSKDSQETAAPARAEVGEAVAVAAPSMPVTTQPAPVVGTAVQPPAPPPAPAPAIEPPAPIRRVAAPAPEVAAAPQPPMRGGPRPAESASAPGMTAQPGPTGPRANTAPASGGVPAPAVPPPVPGTAAPLPGPGSAAPPAGVAPPAAPAMRPAAPARPAVSAPGRAALPPAPPAPPSPPVAGLPADAPKLVISGGVYSTNPAQRMLIVNGQVFNEGSEVGAGVVLEEIRAKTAVLRFRGAPYTVSF